MTILITGAGPNSFLGKHIVKAFNDIGLGKEIFTFSSKEYNLTNLSATTELFNRVRPDVVLHAAALCGGIKKNQKMPADMVHQNIKMASNIFDCIYKYDIKRIYSLGTVCMYPKYCPTPFKEINILDGAEEETNKPYGDSKRLLLTLHQAYRQQYGVGGAFFVPVNMHGEKDHFDLEDSHVIPALIVKFIDAVNNKKETVECWGSGNAYREFLYAGDLAALLAQAVKNDFDYPDPINVGTGQTIQIRALAELIAELTGFAGKILFNGAVSDGQPQRQLDVSRAKELLGFEAKIDLKTGLKNTIKWYRENYGQENSEI
jgi:GDP-L-fucose synthase